MTLPVCFDEAHSHIFEATLAKEFTSPTESAWVSWTVARRYHLGVELETVPRRQLFSKRCCKGSRFLRAPLTSQYLPFRWAWLYLLL